MKVNSQFSALRKGALDLSLVPMSYAGGEVPETNIGLMPALVPSYEVGSKWKTAEVGKLLSQILADKGIVIVTWIWQAGGVASRTKPLVTPDDAKGMKVRGGSREMDMMFKEAGASVLSLPSNEIYAAMQTGAMDAALTSSTSLISFRLEEVSKYLTSGRGKSYWFMFEPLMMSKEVFDKLPKAQQDAIMAVGAELEKFARRQREGRRHRRRRASTPRPARRSTTSTTPTLKKWQAIAQAGVEGLRRQERELRQAARRWPRSCCEPGGADAVRAARAVRLPRPAPSRRCVPLARARCVMRQPR